MKRFITLALVIVMVLVVLAGCAAPAAEPTKAPEDDPITTDPAGEPTEKPVETGPIKIGYMDTLTTTLAASMPWVDVGMNLAVKTINDAGGINGRPIEVVKKDTGNDPAITTERMSELKDEGCVAIVGPSSDSLAPAAAQWSSQNKMVVLQTGTASTKASIENASPYFFFPGFNAWQIGKLLALNTVEPLQAKSFVFVGTDGAAPNDVQAYYYKEARKIDPAFTSRGDYRVNTTNTEFSTIVSAINAADPDVLVGGIAGPLFIAFVEQAKLFSLFNTVDYYGWYTTDASNTQAFGADFPAGHTHGVIALPFWFQDEEAKAFVQAWYDMAEELGYGELHPADLGYAAYKGFITLAEALKIAEDFSSEAIAKAMLEIKVDLPFGADAYYREFDHMLITTVWYGTSAWDENFKVPVAVDLIECGEETYPSEEDFFKEAAARNVDVKGILGLD